MSRIASFLALSSLVPTSALAQQVSFQHIIVVVQENRTPDNIFGSNPTFEPGVDIASSGVNSQGATIPLTPQPLQACYDIEHTHTAFNAMYAGGQMSGADLEKVQAKDGRCVLPPNSQFKYADNSNGAVQPYFDIAMSYGFANRMFQTNQGPSMPAHLFLFSGTSAPDDYSPLFVAENVSQTQVTGQDCAAPSNRRVSVIDAAGSEKANPAIFPCFNRSTMADLLDAAQLTWRYYIDANPTIGIEASLWDAPSAISSICQPGGFGGQQQCTGAEYLTHVDTAKAGVLNDITNCNLPAVSWVIPDSPESDHSGGNKGLGPSWVASIINSVGQQGMCPDGETYWNNTAILVTWDDWGGWYDHVAPFSGNGQSNGWGAGYTYGFRVPLLVVSAYTPAGYVDNATHDFGSILAFIESNFGLGHIGAGFYADSYADNLAAFFSGTTPRGFQAIRAEKGPAYFRTAPRSDIGPDDD